MQAAADRHCDGRMVAVHEGGYSELYVPFCGLAVIEQLARTRSKVGGVVCSWGGGHSTNRSQTSGVVQLWLMHPAHPVTGRGRSLAEHLSQYRRWLSDHRTDLKL
jgi:hypothetical protein